MPDDARARDQALAELCPGSSVLMVGGIAASELARRYGTPLYVFAADVLRRRLARVTQALGPRVEVLYSLKANPNAAVVQVLATAGAGAEVASAGEILVAAHAGVPGARIQFAGPGKTGHDFVAAHAHDVACLNLESDAEYEALLAFARARGWRPGVAVRVHPSSALSGSRMRMGGTGQKFGVDAGAVPDLVARIRNDGVCRLLGLHVYAGTQSFDAGGWIQNARALHALARALDQGEPLQLNLGGGFGVPCFKGDGELDLAAVGAGVQRLIAEDAQPRRRWFVELGRYLTAPAGVYLTRVLYAKRAGGRDHLILDGGLHHHGAAAGLGSVVRRSFPIVKADALDAAATITVACGGPLCTPADELAAEAALPPVAAGDLLAVLQSGAYGLTFAPVLFLSHASPAEVLVDGGRSFVTRAAGSPQDALAGQQLPGRS